MVDLALGQEDQKGTGAEGSSRRRLLRAKPDFAMARVWVRRVSGLAAAIGIWAAVTYSGALAPNVLPSPGALVLHLVYLSRHGYSGIPLYDHILASLEQALSGFGMAVVAGIPIGLLLGYYKRLDEFVSPLLSFVRPIPPISYIPLMVLYFGIGDFSKIMLIFIGGFLYILLSTQAGVSAIPEILLRAGRNAGLSRWGIFRKVILPGAMPGILTGLRTSLAICWALVVAAELISSQKGLGYMVENAGNFFDIKTIYVGIFLIGILGLLMDSIVLSVQRRVLHWEGR